MRQMKNNVKNCTEIQTEQELMDILTTNTPSFILFYAPWCSFSQRFLPLFERCSENAPQRCYHMEIDEHPHLCEKYTIDVYPTVLFFTNGIVMKRLDGIRGLGLSEQQLLDFIQVCCPPK